MQITPCGCGLRLTSWRRHIHLHQMFWNKKPVQHSCFTLIRWLKAGGKRICCCTCSQKWRVSVVRACGNAGFFNCQQRFVLVSLGGRWQSPCRNAVWDERPNRNLRAKNTFREYTISSIKYPRVHAVKPTSLSDITRPSPLKLSASKSP